MTIRPAENHVATERPRKCILDAHINTFMSVVSELGYSPATMKMQRALLKNFIKWIQENDTNIYDLDKTVTDRFLIESGRKGVVRRGDNKTLCRFLDHLRDEGVILFSAPIFNDNPLTELKSRYENYLLKERGLSIRTGPRYWRYIQTFLSEQFSDNPIQFCKLCPQDIDNFLLRHAHEQRSKAAQLMVSAMRSFLRFLFRYGETRCDLSTAVQTVAAWPLAEVPKYIKSEEIEFLLENCDRTTAVGRRDYAILLLIARFGLRAGEIASLELDDINWRAAEITIRGKGQFCDRLPLPQSVGETLAMYLKNDRPKCSTRRVFIRNSAPHLGFKGPSAVSMIVRRVVERSGLDTPSKGAHLLRHSLATGMLREGASMAEIGELLRHRSPNSSEIYAKVDIEGLRSIARVWPEIGGAI